MEDLEKDFYIQWIIADEIHFEFREKKYYLTTPTRQARFLAERQFLSTYSEAVKSGLLEEFDIHNLLRKFKLWSDEKEDTLRKLTLDVEDIKVKIFQLYTQSSQRRNYKKALRDTENYIANLLLEKNSLETYSAKSTAFFAKQHFLMGSSIYLAGRRKPLFKNNWFNTSDDSIIQFAYKITSDYILSEGQYRELSRSNQWRNIWASRKGSGNLFGRAIVDLSPSQRQLILFSSMYDNVYKNSECPVDEIIEDDDALDGWMIHQRRVRNKETNKNLIENSITSQKILNSGQIYVMCNPEDASKVYDCNDTQGRMRIRSIINQIEKEGCVDIMNLKDTRSEILRKVAALR